jgi:hypothetical protein
MAKQPTNTSKPTGATLPGGGVSARLSDFLKAGGPSAKPPTAGRSTGGGLPQNRHNTGGKR